MTAPAVAAGDVRAGAERGAVPLPRPGTYVDDVHRDGELTAVVVRAQEASGRLASVDAARALAVPGVRAVLTAADLPSPVPTVPIRSFPTPALEAAVQPVLAFDRVRYVGEPVALVVADDPYRAEDAAERVAVAIEADAAVVDPDDPGAELLCRFESDDGDVEAAFAEATVVAGDRFVAERHTGLPIETRGLVAEWAADGGLDVWGPTKFLDFTRATLARWLGLDPGQVRCHRVAVGGMFGVRGELYPEDFLIPWAARVVGAPVRWCEDRREHLLATNHAPELRNRIEVALGADGRLLAFRSDSVVDMGAYARTNGARLARLAIEELPGPYDWGAFAATVEGRRTARTPIGSVRAPCAAESTFFRERAIDLAARAAGLDPVEVRRASLVPATAMPYTRRYGGDLHPHLYVGGDYPRTLDRLAAAADLDGLRARAARRRDAGEAVGVGTALFVAHSGLGGSERVTVELADCRATVVTAASEIGQGLDRMLALVAAEELGIEPADVTVRSGATTPDADTRGTFSSRLTIFAGNATRAACAELRRLADGRPWADCPPLRASGEHRDDEAAYGIGGHVALVSVDRALGAVTVERLVVAYDCGRAIDPESVRGQLAGGAVHGAGIALLESIRHDANGQPLGASFVEYLLPTATDVPDVEVLVIEDGMPANPLGVRGAGEAGVIGVPAAIAGAVADATGTRPRSLPLRVSPAPVGDRSQ